MERADGNRRMWLLKSTSGHHRPECLASALALGILAGLVPKLNLLAVVLYGLILILPVHTLFALVVSAGVALISFQLDHTAHELGQWLLRHSSLRPLWSSLERVPLVPWMSLHNTVVLGHLVIGTTLLAPIYLISLRVFERLEYGVRTRRRSGQQSIESYAPVTVEESEPLITRQEPFPRRDATPDRRQGEVVQPLETTVDQSPYIIPPPKLRRPAAESGSRVPMSTPDEPILFEPIDESQRVNAWHMRRANGESQHANISASSQPSSHAAQAKPTGHASPASTRSNCDTFYPQMTQASANDRASHRVNERDSERELERGGQLPHRDLPLPLPPQRAQEPLDSIQLAHSASEVLAWVDDLLDECMAAEGMTLISQEFEGTSHSTAVPTIAAEADVDISNMNDSPAQPRWLLETTIEIVRLTDETMSDPLLETEQATHCQSHSYEPETPSTENFKVMPADSMTRAWPSVGSVATASSALDTPAPVQDAGEPTILNLNQASSRSQAANRTGFQQLVMAGVDKEDDSNATLPIEPVKGECLAYLLGHLRQTREGKST